MLKKIRGRGALCCALAAACAGVCALSLAGCSGDDAKTYSVSSLYMGSDASIVVTVDPSVTEDGYADRVKGEFDELADECNAVLAALDRDLSTSLTPAEAADLDTTEDITYCVYRFNQAGPGETVQIDYYTYDLLRIALDMYDRTDGYYNPAVYYNVMAYGFGETQSMYPSKASDLPTAAETEAYTNLAGCFGNVKIREDEKAGTYYATKPEYTVSVDGETLSMKIDLGGIGKGYATDIVSGLMDEYNEKYSGDFRYGYFSFGSSSLAVKQYYGSDEGLYTVSLTNPRVYGASYARFTGKNFVLSTSGDYEQYYRIDGTLYCHIINPKTGVPISTGTSTDSSMVTVTLVGGLAVEDDAYTTALMAMGGSQALAYIQENLSDLQYVMVTCSGGAYETSTNMDSLQTVSKIEGELE